MEAIAYKVTGRLNAVLHKKDGSVEHFEANNLVVDTGIDFIAAALASTDRPAILSHIAIGTSDTVVADSDTTLGVEAARRAAAYNHDNGSTSFTMQATFPAGVGTGDIVEAGVFNNNAGGVMFNRVVFSTIPKEADDSLDITFTFTFTPSS